MVKHIVTWCFKEEVEVERRSIIANKMKEELEALVGKVPGLMTAYVEIHLLNSSTHDIALFTTLETKDALDAYQQHKDHCHVADTYVRPYVCNRACLDFEE